MPLLSRKKCHTRQTPCFAMVCVNNVNRSMAAHALLQDHGLCVRSFGCNHRVCYPCRPGARPLSFPFSSSYSFMAKQLHKSDEETFKRCGVFEMLERNAAVKDRPERWQDQRYRELKELDVAICFDKNAYIAVLQDLQWKRKLRLHAKKHPLQVLCMDTDDTAIGADDASKLALELCQELHAHGVSGLANPKAKDLMTAFKAHQGINLDCAVIYV